MMETDRTQLYFETERLSVGYHGIPLIENIRIGLKKGEILTLIGPNGAGKSTVLKSIARQLSPISGTVCLGNENLADMSAKTLAQTMSVLLTERLQTEKMTCEDVVSTGRYPYTGYFGKLSEQDKKIVKESMDLVHVTAIRERDFTKISDGQKQRVMLARAICQEPELIILDEPTSFLDIKYKLEFLSVLQEMRHKKGLTVIMSLHELELAERVSDKILCLNGTYADRFGTPQEIFTSGYISSLFGIRTGSFDEENGSMELEASKGEAEVFVIAGGGSGRMLYRQLQRERIPFSTGILFGQDLDYPSAKALSVCVVEEENFEPIKLSTLETAKKSLNSCKKVICCKRHFGTLEKANEELLDYAFKIGKKVEFYDIMSARESEGACSLLTNGEIIE